MCHSGTALGDRCFQAALARTVTGAWCIGRLRRFLGALADALSAPRSLVPRNGQAYIPVAQGALSPGALRAIRPSLELEAARLLGALASATPAMVLRRSRRMCRALVHVRGNLSRPRRVVLMFSSEMVVVLWRVVFSRYIDVLETPGEERHEVAAPHLCPGILGGPSLAMIRHSSHGTRERRVVVEM